MVNDIGVEHQGNFVHKRGAVLFGQRKRFRLVLRLRKLVSKVKVAFGPDERWTNFKIVLKTRKEMAALVARIGRRPWKETTEFAKRRLVQTVRRLPLNKLRILIRAVYKTQDTTGRSICRYNLRRILRYRKDLCWKYVKFTSPALGSMKAQKAVEAGIKKWGVRFQRKHRVLTIVETVFAPRASRSALDILNNTAVMGRRKKQELRCMCHLPIANGMHKENGHVLSPLMTFMESSGERFPAGWSVRSRCRPDWDTEASKLQEELEGVCTSVERHTGISSKLTIDWKQCESGFTSIGHGCGVQVTEVAMERWRERLAGFVISPIDKYPAEGAIVCAEQWGNAVQDLAKNLRDVRGSRNQLLRRMGRADARLRAPPYGKLRGVRKHRFGVMRAWPKWKTLRPLWKDLKRDTGSGEVHDDGQSEVNCRDKPPSQLRAHTQPTVHPISSDVGEGDDDGAVACGDCAGDLVQDRFPGNWELVRWRPLVSYAAHHWKFVLSQLSRWCVFTIRSLNLGFHVSNPRSILEQVHVFNGGFRTKRTVELVAGMDHRRRRGGAVRRPPMRVRTTPIARLARRRLRMRVRDLQSFFVEVPRQGFDNAVTDVLRRIQELGDRQGFQWAFY